MKIVGRYIRAFVGAAVLVSIVTRPVVGQLVTNQPDWEKTAGGKREFEVASIRLEEPGKFTLPNFALDTGNGPVPPGGRFHADFPLRVYIAFAYKLWLTPEQLRNMLAHLPSWVATDSFVIDARAEGNPTKDQMRLMVRSLLVDRFKLAIHFEAQETPVLAMSLIKPGKLGPNLRPHSEGPACDVPLPKPDPTTTLISPGMFPPNCDLYVLWSLSNHTVLFGSRNTTMAQVAESFPGMGRLGRPVVDETGLAGTYDFFLNFSPEITMPASSGMAMPGFPVPQDPAPEAAGPSFLEAIKDQLGIKLVPKSASIEVLVIDHIEHPSPN